MENHDLNMSAVKRTQPTVLAASVLLIAGLLGSAAAVAAEMNPVTIEEWPNPYAGRGRDPYAAGPDEIWFVGQRGHYLARFTPSTEEFFKRDLPGQVGPHNTIVQSNGIVWYAGNRVAHIGRYDPATDEIEIIHMPDPAARDPHTLVFDEGEKHIWFTVQGGNMIGRLTLADRSVELITVPTERSRPYGIKLAPDGTPWIVLLGTNKLASVDPMTMELTEYKLPAAEARPRRLEITGDGRIWYADYARGYLGLYDPASERFDEWALPSGSGSRPYGMAMDGDDRVWIVESGASPNLFVGFDTEAEKIVSVTEIPSGTGSVRHMDYEETTGSVWFGTDNETIGRALVRPH
jgi:virginiamycin B lyase